MSDRVVAGVRPRWRRRARLGGALAMLLAMLITLGATPGGSVHAAVVGPPCGTGGVEFLGFSDALNKATYNGTNVGGLSGLVYDASKDVYYSQVDNEQSTPARFYTLRIPLNGEALGTPSVTAVTTLRDANGQPFTGANFDGEGIALLRSGDLLISSETEPAIRRFAPDGTLRATLPVPDRFRVAPAGEGRSNLTFESLNLTPDQRFLFTAVEGALTPDGQTSDGRQRIRILRYEDRAPNGFTLGAQYYYQTEATGGVGVVEIVALTEQELLVLDRGFVAGSGNTVRIYRAFLAGATDVTNEASLATTSATPVRKELVADLASCPASGATNPGTQANPLLDNFESLALGPQLAGGRQVLMMQSDDNFGAVQVGRVVALALPRPFGGVAPQVTLEARAVLPADTFAPGPPSGGQLPPNTPVNGRTPPFPSQPVQGISAILPAGDGEYWAMPDNGFGAKNNSADFLLRVYRIRPTFETASGGAGTVAVGDFLQLRDPDKRIPFAIVNGTSAERLLTGADFDIESIRRDYRGDLWFGDEFGPWLLHTDATGKLLEAPIALPGVKAAENATLAQGETANLPTSRGFEGTAISTDGRTLYPSLEGALKEDSDQRRRYIYEFDLVNKTYTGKKYQLRLEAADNSIGDLTTIAGGQLLLIERDNGQGVTARFKRIYLLDLNQVGADGFVAKREVVDLMAMADPAKISLPGKPGDLGLGENFTFPFQTIESVLPLGGGRLLVANDNNYPFSAGRNPAQSDDNELIILRVGNLPEPTAAPSPSPSAPPSAAPSPPSTGSGGNLPGLPNTGGGWAAGDLGWFAVATALLAGAAAIGVARVRRGRGMAR